MLDWIIIVVLYGFVAGFLRLLGGFAAAGEALRHWGEACSTVRDSSSTSTGSR